MPPQMSFHVTKQPIEQPLHAKENPSYGPMLIVIKLLEEYTDSDLCP